MACKMAQICDDGCTKEFANCEDGKALVWINGAASCGDADDIDFLSPSGSLIASTITGAIEEILGKIPNCETMQDCVGGAVTDGIVYDDANNQIKLSPTTMTPTTAEALADAIAPYLDLTGGCTLNVTFNDDLTATNAKRITFNSTTCTLNIPRGIYGTIVGANGTIALTAGVFTDVAAIMTNDLGTSGITFTPGVGYTIVRSGQYDITFSVGSDTLCTGGTLFAGLLRNGVVSGRFSAFIAPAFATQALGVIPNFPLVAGDVISVAAATDCTGATVESAYLGLRLVE